MSDITLYDTFKLTVMGTEYGENYVIIFKWQHLFKYHFVPGDKAKYCKKTYKYGHH